MSILIYFSHIQVTGGSKISPQFVIVLTPTLIFIANSALVSLWKYLALRKCSPKVYSVIVSNILREATGTSSIEAQTCCKTVVKNLEKSQ